MSLASWREKHAVGMVGESPALLEALTVIERVSQTDCTVLITGESGTGKDLMARALHSASERHCGNFVPLNCGAIPEALLESELFGHTRGAFTGAVSARVGRFAMADGGTLFLDEVGEMSVHLQGKLLRVLQEKEFSPVGDSKTYKCDVRIVAATNRVLEEMVEAGEFRADLYWRLNVVPIEMPPLRNRRCDVANLADHFIAIHNARHKRELVGISAAAMEMMEGYEWPGNIRQLENLVQRVVVVKGEGSLEPEDLPPKVLEKSGARSGRQAPSVLPDDGLDLRDEVEQFENSLILQALERTSWNKNRAAGLLKLNRTTLVEKLKKKGLSNRRPSETS